MKRNILNHLSTHYYFNIELEKWIKLIKHFKENGFTFEIEDYVHYQYYEPYIVKVAKSANQTYLKALIMEGISAKPLYNYYLHK